MAALSPPENYVEEAADLLERLGPLAPGPRTLLELGSGGDVSPASETALQPDAHGSLPGMLAVNRRSTLNPSISSGTCEACAWSASSMSSSYTMRSYATDAASVLATLQTAAIHCRPGGVVVASSSTCTGNIHASTDEGGYDGLDGRGFRTWSGVGIPIPPDDTYIVDYAFLLREASGQCGPHTIGNIEGLFARARWLEWFAAAGLSVLSNDIDQWGRDVFLARAAGAP
mgnify:CR=1 FL=1